MMNTNVKTIERSSEQRGDLLKWGLVAIIFIIALVANYYYAAVIGVTIRLIAWLVIACVAGAIAFQTTQGQKAFEFAKEAKIEIRKVTWPTKQETIRTTLLVMGVVLIAALLLWAMDSVLLVLVKVFIGQRG